MCSNAIFLRHTGTMKRTNPTSETLRLRGKVTCRRNASGWWVYFPRERDGKTERARKRFPTRAFAFEFAREKSEEIMKYGVACGSLPPEVHGAYSAYRECAARFAKKEITIPSFGDLMDKALKSLIEEKIPGESAVSEGVERYLEVRKRELSEKGYQSLHGRLQNFTSAMGRFTMRSVTAPMIEDWLAGLTRQRASQGHDPRFEGYGLSAHSLNHYRAAVTTFFNYARDKGWVYANPVKSVARATPAQPKPEVLPPEEVAALLNAAVEMKPSVIPALALQLFAGLRLAEAAQIKPHEYGAAKGEFFKLAASKSGSRKVPITDALRAWLNDYPLQHDSARPVPIHYLRRKLGEVFAHVGCQANLQSLRISYLRYRMETTPEVAQIAAETGTPVAILSRIAELPVAEGAADQFFQIKPFGKGCHGPSQSPVAANHTALES